MAEEDLGRLCRFGEVKTHRRGVYGLCNRAGKEEQECIGNIWYSTGHASKDSYIDFDKVRACECREERKNGS